MTVPERVFTESASFKRLCDCLIMRSHQAGLHFMAGLLAYTCNGPQAVWAIEEWVTAPSGARLKLTRAKFRLDFESCLADCGNRSSLAVIGSMADQEFVNQLLINESAYNVLIGNHRSPGSQSSWMGTPSGGDSPSFFNWRPDTTFLPGDEQWVIANGWRPSTTDAKTLTASALLKVWGQRMQQFITNKIWSDCHDLEGFCHSGHLGHAIHTGNPFYMYPGCVSMVGVRGYAHKLPVGAWDLSLCHLRHQPMGDHAGGIAGDIGSVGMWLNGQLPPSPRSRNFKRHCLCQAGAVPSDAYLAFLKNESMDDAWQEEQYSMIFAAKRQQALTWNLILFGVIIPALALLPAVYRTHREMLSQNRLCHRKFWPCHRRSRSAVAEGGIEAGIAPIPQNGTAADRSEPVETGEIQIAIERLQSATVGAELLHARVRFATARIGFIALLVALLPSMAATLANQNSVLDFTYHTHGSTTFFIPVAPWALGLLLLSVRPTERERIGRLCIAVSMIFFVGGIGAIVGANLPLGTSGYTHDAEKRSLPKGLKIGGFYFLGFAFLYSWYSLLLCIRCVSELAKWPVPPTRIKLHCLWRVVRMMYIVMVLVSLNGFAVEILDLSIQLGASSKEFQERLRLTLFPFVWTEWAEYNGRNRNSAIEVGNRAAWVNAFSAIMAFFAFSPTNRGKLIWFFGSLGRNGNRLREAAYIRTLLGEVGGNVEAQSIQAVISFAASRFRGIAVTDLPYDVFDRARPSAGPSTEPSKSSFTSRLAPPEDDLPEVGAKPARFGEVHAFVTHCWQDPGHSKLSELRKWAAQNFPSGSSGALASAPLVWIDVVCLRVGARPHCGEEELQCLPFFISGCKNLLILAGDTYPSRLWCAFEVFVFLKLGRQSGEILVRQVMPHLSVESKNMLKDKLMKFDANKAKCCSEEDRQQLLSIIEAAFGNATYFNQEMRRLFYAKLHQRHAA